MQGDQENNDSSQSCFNELSSCDDLLSELVCSKDANCVDHIGSGTAANANVDSQDRQLGSWATGSSGATPVNEKPAHGPKSIVLTDTSSVLRTVCTLNHNSPIPKRKRTYRGRKQSEDDLENNDSSHKGGKRKTGKHAGLDIARQTGRSCFNERQLGSWASGSSGATPVNEKPALGPKSMVLTDTSSALRTVCTLNQISIPKRKRTNRGRKQIEVRNATSANAGSSSPSNGRGENKTKTKPKRKMARLLSLGSGLEIMKETSPVGVKQKKSHKKNTKAKSSAQVKTKAKEKVDQLSASGSGLGIIAETPSSSSPSKGESGEPMNTGGTGVNKEAGFVFPPDGYLDLDGLSNLEIPDDIDSYSFEPADLVALLEIPMEDLLDVNRCF